MNEENSAAPTAPAPLAGPPSLATTGSIHLGIQATGRIVTIPEHAAMILLQLLDRISLGGSDLKFNVAIAQRALEEGVRAMQAEAARPPNRQARRAAARKAKAE